MAAGGNAIPGSGIVGFAVDGGGRTTGARPGPPGGRTVPGVVGCGGWGGWGGWGG